MTTPDSDGTLSQAAQASPEPDTGWVTLAEASTAAGMSISGLRKWYRDGHLETREGPGPTGPRKLVRLEEVLARAGRHAPPAREPAPTERGLIPVSTFEALQAAYLMAQEGRLSAEVRAQVAEHQLARREEELTRLREELAQARRPWWRRAPKA